MSGHDFSDPMSLVNQLDATFEAISPQCESCTPDVEVIPASGTRFVLGLTHQPGCPEHVED